MYINYYNFLFEHSIQITRSKIQIRNLNKRFTSSIQVRGMKYFLNNQMSNENLPKITGDDDKILEEV